MIKATLRLNKDILPEMRKDTRRVLVAASRGAVEHLRGKLELHETSGELWSSYGLKNRSSVFGEYPQEQTAELLNSVGFKSEDFFNINIGFFNAAPVAGAMEFLPPDEGGRKPLEMFFIDEAEETFEVMRRAVEES